MLRTIDKFKKRLFDLILSIVMIGLTWWLMVLAWLIASYETKSNGLFLQKRIGKKGKPFIIFKIKTMRDTNGVSSTVTTSNDMRITKSGALFRRMKIDELPQLFNVMLGSMSFVGPRPDVEGFADQLQGDDRKILEVAPGITGPASLKYRNEEEILSQQDDPQRYNREVIWPDKVKINREYVENWSFVKDMLYIKQTALG